MLPCVCSHVSCALVVGLCARRGVLLCGRLVLDHDHGHSRMHSYITHSGIQAFRHSHIHLLTYELQRIHWYQRHYALASRYQPMLHSPQSSTYMTDIQERERYYRPLLYQSALVLSSLWKHMLLYPFSLLCLGYRSKKHAHTDTHKHQCKLNKYQNRRWKRKTHDIRWTRILRF